MERQRRFNVVVPVGVLVTAFVLLTRRGWQHPSGTEAADREGTLMNGSCILRTELFLLLVMGTLCPVIRAGFDPELHVITQADALEPECVYAADLDGDGDMDILSASSGDDKIAWYANEGRGHFGAQQVVSATTERASDVQSVDLDGDGDHVLEIGRAHV